MAEQEMRRRETDRTEDAQQGRRATDNLGDATPRRRASDHLGDAPPGRRKTDHSYDTRHGRRKTDHPVYESQTHGVRSFLEAWGIIIVTIAIVALGVSLYARPVQVQVVPAVTSPALPGDVPAIPGSTLTRYALSGETSVYNYTIGNTTRASVQDYYKAELEKRGWVRQPRSNETEAEFKMEGLKLLINPKYEGSHVLVQIRILKSS